MWVFFFFFCFYCQPPTSSCMCFVFNLSRFLNWFVEAAWKSLEKNLPQGWAVPKKRNSRESVLQYAFPDLAKVTFKGGIQGGADEAARRRSRWAQFFSNAWRGCTPQGAVLTPTQTSRPDRSPCMCHRRTVGCRCCCVTCLRLTLGLLQTLAVHRDAAVAVQLLPLWWRRLVLVCRAAVGSLFALLTTVPSESEVRYSFRKRTRGRWYYGEILQEPFKDLTPWPTNKTITSFPAQPFLPSRKSKHHIKPPNYEGLFIVFNECVPLSAPKCSSPIILFVYVDLKTDEISLTDERRKQRWEVAAPSSFWKPQRRTRKRTSLKE